MFNDPIKRIRGFDWSRRDAAIDSLRGVAVILMVAGHVIGSNPADGLRVSDDSNWHLVYMSVADLRMPLFTMLSGFVYGLRPVTQLSGYKRFAWGKVKRLLVPLVVVGGLWGVTQALVPGTNSTLAFTEMWRVWVYGSGYIWFLQSIFLIMLVVGMLDIFRLLDSPWKTLIAVVISGVVSAAFARGIPESLNVFSISGFLLLLPFFILGRGVKLFWENPRRETGLLLLLAALVLFIWRFREIRLGIDLYNFPRGLLAVALGLIGLSAVFAFRERLTWKPLARLGYFSFGIYLLHIFATAGSRMALEHLGITNTGICFAVGLIAGLIFPVCVECTLGQVPWVSRLVFGQRPSLASRKPVSAP